MCVWGGVHGGGGGCVRACVRACVCVSDSESALTTQNICREPVWPSGKAVGW